MAILYFSSPIPSNMRTSEKKSQSLQFYAPVKKLYHITVVIILC